MSFVGRTDAAPVAKRGAVVLAKALEDTREKDDYHLSGLAHALAALTAQMSPNDAAPLAARAAVVLAEALENSQGKVFLGLPRLVEALAALAAQFLRLDKRGSRQYRTCLSSLVRLHSRMSKL